MSLSFLDLVKATDVVPYPSDPEYALVLDTSYDFLSHNGIKIGRLTAPVYQALVEGYSDHLVVTPRSIQLHPDICNTFEARNQLIARIAADWRAARSFRVLEGWRDELYTVFNPSHVPYLLVERSASPLFGVITYGVHIVGYVPANADGCGSPLRVWVPRRSATKATFSGMLDNTVAGGLGYPYGVFNTCIKECYEEAGLAEDYVRKRLTSAGVITYAYQHDYDKDDSSSTGLYQPEVEYIYDLRLDIDTVPQPIDGEVAEFNLMTVDEIKVELANGSFKPNTALVQIDFFIRHGFITSENEPDFMEIQARTHRKMEYPVR